MRLALNQFNATVGDIEGNLERIRDGARDARAAQVARALRLGMQAEGQ